MYCLRRFVFAAGAAVVLAAGSTPAVADVVQLSPIADNTLYQDATGSLSNGAGQHFFAGTNSGPDIRRGLLRFDVAAALPADATVTSATLQLYVSRSAGDTAMVSLHRTLSDWGEGSTDAGGGEGGGGPATPGSATWLHTFYDQALWANPGGDFDPTASAELSVGGPGHYAWSSPSLAADVQAWLDGTLPDFGWVVLGDELAASTAKRFDTRENPDTTLHPRLVVEFVPAPGAIALIPVLCGIAAGRRPQRRTPPWVSEQQQGTSARRCSR